VEAPDGESLDQHSGHHVQKEASLLRAMWILWLTLHNHIVGSILADDLQVVRGDGHHLPVSPRADKDRRTGGGSVHCVLDPGEISFGTLLAIAADDERALGSSSGRHGHGQQDGQYRRNEKTAPHVLFPSPSSSWARCSAQSDTWGGHCGAPSSSLSGLWTALGSAGLHGHSRSSLNRGCSPPPNLLGTSRKCRRCQRGYKTMHLR